MANQDTFQLLAITSLRSDSNLFVGADGRWLTDYVPASLRAYPFMLVKPDDSNDLVLCVDEESDLVLEAGQGEAFFDVEGTSSQALKDVMSLLSNIERSRIVTQVAVDALQSEGLIQAWPLNIQTGEQTLAVNGLYRIDEAGLNALPEDSFLRLRKVGALPVAYAQLLSMNQLAQLSTAAFLQNQLQDKLAAKAASQPVHDTEAFFKLSDSGTIKF